MFFEISKIYGRRKVVVLRLNLCILKNIGMKSINFKNQGLNSIYFFHKLKNSINYKYI